MTIARADLVSLIRQRDFELDCLDLEIVGLRRLAVEQTRERLGRLGYDVKGYRPVPLPHPSETRSARHPSYDAGLGPQAPNAPRPRGIARRNTGRVLRVS